MKVGTIVRNMWQPSYESLLVYTGTSGRYARCLWVINGEFHGMHNFYKSDILNDLEHFPIVGYFDYKKVFVDAVRNAIIPESDKDINFPTKEEKAK